MGSSNRAILAFGLSLLMCLGIGIAGWDRLDAPNLDSEMHASKAGKKAPSGPVKSNSAKIPLKDRIDLAMAQEVMMTKDPATGEVPRERLLSASAYADQMRAAGKVNAALSVNWDERGPSNVSGRTRAIMIDPNDGTGNTIFAGGVGGGLFKTTNITAANPNWAPINDLMGNLAITTLAFDPSNTQTMYAGTGEGYFNADAIRGLGIFKSVNGGATWTQLASTNNATFRFVQKIAVTNTGVILACTQAGGVQRSTNGGTTWTKVLGSGLGITGAGSNIAWDAEIAANGDIYASLDGSVHKSTNAGATFGAAQTLPLAASRIELACAPSDANYVYCIIENANIAAGICRTIDGGASWVNRTKPADADPGIGATDFSRGQAWYDLSIAVDPNNRDRMFVGGVDLFVTGDGAGTWTQVAHWYGGFGFQYVHADQHIVIFQPGSSSICYFGNDGGVYRSANANVGSPAIAFKGNNYNVTQFYACAMHPTALTDYFLAGAQDNGSQQFSNGGINATIEVTGGDGAFCHIDQDQPQFQFTAYVQNDFFRSADGGNTWTSISTTGGLFISPTDYDNVGNRLYGHRGSNNYLRWDNPQSGNTFATVAVAGFGGQVACVTVSPNTANRVFFGINNGDVFRVDNAHTGAPTATNISTGLPTGYPSCVEVEIGNDNHLLVCYSNYGLNSIWESVNGGTTWTSVEGNMPDMPVRWLLLNPGDNTQALAATELGVWYTDLLAGGATVWTPGNTGLANTRVDMLQMRTSDNLVAAATHGRGLFTSDVFTVPTALFSATPSITYVGKTVQFTDNSYRPTSWVWNFGDGSPTSSLQNPTHIYSAPGKYDITLTINLGASTLTKVGFIHILPDRGTPYAITDGGNFEVNILDFGPNNVSGTDFERGSSAVAGKNGTVSPSNAWVTGITGNYNDNCIAQLWTPSFNMTAVGTYTLGFSSRFITETGYDGFRVEYSLDKGTSWLPVGTTTAAGWYNDNNSSGTTVFPANEAFFSGSVGAAYVNYTRDISFLAGNSEVAFRFNFGSDVSVFAAGVAIDNFFITGPSNPASGLPVNASPLTGAWLENDVRLDWITYGETNNRGFTIMRSEDGMRFEDVGFVSGAGNASQTIEYSWVDAEASLDRYFYRYRQTDFDGTSRFSNTVELNRTVLQDAVDVYPNPFVNQIHIQLRSAPSTGTEVSLWSIEGKKLDTFVPNWTEDGLASLVVPTDLPSGTYLLRLRSGSQTRTFRLLH
ncbi:MAG: PKD domain-containing protein [Bacteroidia bacterium]|nr:PKD domain-containing protein [Bacteroidia bacterium]